MWNGGEEPSEARPMCGKARAGQEVSGRPYCAPTGRWGTQAVEPHGALTVEAAVSGMEVPDVQPVPWPHGVSSFTDWGSSDCLHSPLVAVVPRMPIACAHHSPCSH